MTLSEVIREARREYDRLSLAIQSGAEPPIALLDNGEGGEDRYIAAAVAAHLESDAVVERAAAASCYDHEGDNAPFTFADDPVTEWWNCRPNDKRAHYRALARAAIRAAIGGG